MDILKAGTAMASDGATTGGAENSISVIPSSRKSRSFRCSDRGGGTTASERESLVGTNSSVERIKQAYRPLLVCAITGRVGIAGNGKGVENSSLGASSTKATLW